MAPFIHGDNTHGLHLDKISFLTGSVVEKENNLEQMNQEKILLFILTLIPLHWNDCTGAVNMSLSFILEGSAHFAIPGSTKSFFTHSANHCRLQSQYNGFDPKALHGGKKLINIW